MASSQTRTSHNLWTPMVLQDAEELAVVRRQIGGWARVCDVLVESVGRVEPRLLQADQAGCGWLAIVVSRFG